MSRATVHEVAARARVSTQTVSRVINDVPRVAARTRQRVLAAIKALDYEPNTLARGLVTKRTKTIGVVVYDIANPYYGQLVRGMEDAAFARGYDLIIGNTDADPRKDLSYLGVFRRRRVDGILASIADPSGDDLGVWSRASCPVVFLDKFFSSDNCSYVTVNNRQSAFHAVDHLLQLGHRRIGIVTASTTASDSVKERFAGYREALAARGVAFAPELFVTCERQSEEGGYAALRDFLRQGDLPTALFCTNDAIAIGAMRAIYEAGLEIPGDISVVGFDDVPIAGLLRVALTTVAQPIHRMGAAAVELLTERIEGGAPLPPRHVVLDAHLVVRQSTAPPRGQH
ncbi:MAG: LacI family DNA-binding transcriptional regulator [Spirochaetia bacterium]